MKSNQKDSQGILIEEQRKLAYRLELLMQKFSILNEIKLRLASNVSPETSDDYSNLVNNNYGNFFRGIRDSLRLAFYIELRGFIGVSVKEDNTHVGLDRYDQSTFRQFIHSEELIQKVDLSLEYSSLIDKHLASIKMIQEVRHFTAHSKPLEDVYQKFIPNYDETKSLLNDLGSILESASYGIIGVTNELHSFADNNAITEEVERIFKRLDFSESSKETNEKFMIARREWYRLT